LVQLRIAPQNPKTPFIEILKIVNYSQKWKIIRMIMQQLMLE
jgi:hypothetical protein